MGPSINEATVRAYLLGRVSDENTLEGIEDLMFTDEEFCSEVALAEDGLINDYVFGRLNEADVKSFQATLENNSDRRFKLELTQALRVKALAGTDRAAEARPSLLAALKAFFRQPQYVGAFAILLIAAVTFVIYFKSKDKSDDLAELRSIYQQSRPTETRLAEFSYAPFAELRGAPEPANQTRLRRIEINLIDAAEKSSTAETHHALGVFYLTQRKFDDAIREFESALKFAPGSARVHNDLGVAHFERAKKTREKKLEDLSRSLEEFTKATQLDGSFLEALFNKSLALQEMGMPREAKESWTIYLQKDPSSPWADEARKHLTSIASDQTLFKSAEQVLADFLAAYRNHDQERAQKIHNETKGLLKGPAVPLQLARRYLLAKQRPAEDEAKESLAALTFIGQFEQTQNSEFFFLN